VGYNENVFRILHTHPARCGITARVLLQVEASAESQAGVEARAAAPNGWGPAFEQMELLMKVTVRTAEQLISAGFIQESDKWVFPREKRQPIGKYMSTYLGKTIEVGDEGKTHFFQTDDTSHWAWPREALILEPVRRGGNVFEACEAGDVASVRRLLQVDRALPNAREAGGITPLHSAATEGRVEVVELLLSAGANVNATNQWNVTPIYLAAALGHKEVCSLLLARGANVRIADHKGETPLQAARRNGHQDVIDLLDGKATTRGNRPWWCFWRR